MALHYVLKTVNSDMSSRWRKNFIWPKSGSVFDYNWEEASNSPCGLHGLLEGQGNEEFLDYNSDAKWIVFTVQENDMVLMKGCIKAKKGIVVFSGSRKDATTYLISLGIPTPFVGMEMTTENGVLVGGNRAYLKGGDFSILKGGDVSVIYGGKGATIVSGFRSNIDTKDGALVTTGLGACITGGNQNIISSGAFSNILAKSYCKLSTGDYSIVEVGNDSSIYSGMCSDVISGSFSNIVSGMKSIIKSGFKSFIKNGRHSNVISGPHSTIISAEHSIIKAGAKSKLLGNNGCFLSGGSGSTLHFRFNYSKRHIPLSKSVRVGEDNIEPDVLYKLNARNKIVKATGKPEGCRTWPT